MNDKLRRILASIKNGTPEERQAAIDAITAIKDARKVNEHPELIPDESTTEVEQGLNQPTELSSDDIEVDDPDHLLNSTESEEETNDTDDSSDTADEESEKSNSERSNSDPDKKLGSKDNTEDDFDDSTTDEPINDPSNNELPETEDSSTTDQSQSSDEFSDDEGSYDDEDYDDEENYDDNDDIDDFEDEYNENEDDDSFSDQEDDYNMNVDGDLEDDPTNNSTNEDSFDPNDFSDETDPIDLDEPEEEHEAPEKNTLLQRKIAIGRLNQLAKEAVENATKKNVSQDLIDKVNESMAALNNLSDDQLADLDEGLFNNLTETAINAIDKIDNVKYSNDLDIRIQKIQTDLADQETKKELDLEDRVNIGNAERAKEASEREKDKYKRGNFKTMQQFNLKFYKAIKDQVEDIEDDVDTWGAINKYHSDDGIVAKGTHIEDTPNGSIPTIDIYIDCSGSWSDYDIKLGENIVKQVLEFEDRGEIITRIYYCSVGIFDNKEIARSRPGTYFWNELIANIKANNTKNAIIITDSDLEYYFRNGYYSKSSKTLIDGIVYWIWKDGDRADTLPTLLRGRADNDEFAFTSI